MQGNTLYLATWKGLSISHNGGGSFINKTTADGLEGNMVDQVYVKGNTIYAVTEKGLSISYNGGKSFVKKSKFDGLTKKIYRIAVHNKDIYVLDSSGHLGISHNNGKSFKFLKSSDINPHSFQLLAISPSNEIYLSDPFLSGIFLISSDKGKTFKFC